jgi:hypothetical protein
VQNGILGRQCYEYRLTLTYCNRIRATMAQVLYSDCNAKGINS